MDEKKKKAGAAALREGLRNERRNRASGATSQATSGAGEITSGNLVNSDTEAGATIPAPRGKIERFAPTGGKPTGSNQRDRDDRRGTEGGARRDGRGTRRAEEGNSSVVTHPAAADEAAAADKYPTVGRLMADEAIETGRAHIDLTPDATLPSPVQLSQYKEDYRRTQREGQNVYVLISDPSQFITGDEYKSLLSKKDAEVSTNSPSFNSAAGAKPSFFKGGVLSKEEAEELYEPLIAALGDVFGYADKGLWALCPQLDERPIWSNTTEREDKALAKLLLQRGQKSPGAALLVRETVNSADYVLVGMMFGPRAIETVKAIRERPVSTRQRAKVTLFRGAGQNEA